MKRRMETFYLISPILLVTYYNLNKKGLCGEL